jgi:hypothetical protein
VNGPGKQPCLRPHPPVVHAQRRQQRGAQPYVPTASPFAALDVNQHPPAVDVGDLQMAQLRVPHVGRVQNHQHRAVRQTVGSVDHPLHLFDTQDLGSRRGAFGYGVSSNRYRRFSVFTKKKRNAATWRRTVSGRIFRSRSRYA